MRIIALGVSLCLVACQKPAPAAPDAPAAPVQPHGLRVPSTKCELTLPEGWKRNPVPMPDHILEALKLEERSSIIVREAIDTTLEPAVAAEKKRVEAAWNQQHGFALVREAPLGKGTLLVYRWQPSATAGSFARHLVALLPAGGKVVLVLAEQPESTPEDALVTALSTLSCSPK